MNSNNATLISDFLKQNGLTPLVFEPGSTSTVALAAERIGCAVGQIAKSLLFKDKRNGFHLVVLAGDARVHSGKLKRLVGSETSMANDEETLNLTGYAVGGVCPFGVTKVPIYLDSSLKKWELVYPSAGTDSSGVPITYMKLLEVTKAEECDLASQPKP